MYNKNRCHPGETDWAFYHNRLKRHHGRFDHHHGMMHKDFRRVPANIEETDDQYIVQIFAAALDKTDLKVFTKDDILTVSYQPKEADITMKTYRLKEHKNAAFERAFALNGKILNEEITAAYADGILSINLPKNPETNAPVKDIAVN